MFIKPIENIKTLEQLANFNNDTSVKNESPIPFKDMFVEAVNNVKETDAVVQTELIKAATGETDDLHNLNIASTKAAMALDLVIQLRNKSLDAYNEIMRMGV